MEDDLIDETVSEDTDISVGGLTVSERFISRADWTVSYFENSVQFYVPYAKCANLWTTLLRVYTLDAWICVLCTPLLPLIMFMSYMTFKFFLTFFSVSLIVSVPELLRASLLISVISDRNHVVRLVVFLS